MTTVTSPDALADPIGVIVGLVARREASLDRAVIAEATENVAGGRSKRRRLAQALLDLGADLVGTSGQRQAPAQGKCGCNASDELPAVHGIILDGGRVTEGCKKDDLPAIY